jgi:hypothetical protein
MTSSCKTCPKRHKFTGDKAALRGAYVVTTLHDRYTAGGTRTYRCVAGKNNLADGHGRHWEHVTERTL